MNRITDVEPIEAPARAADGELLSRFLDRGDDPAFAELIARHGPMVFGVCLRRLGQCQDAEDAYQAVFLSLATHGRKLTQRTTVGPWLYTVARQVSAKALRSRRRRHWVFWGKTPEPVTPPPVEAAVDLDAALASLSEPERSAVVLCHLEGLSRSEAAQALAIPEGTLSARLSRALEKLRRKLGKAPLAVLAGAMLVVVPDRLPAATAGLVRHLRDGTLDDWAPPAVLDLYRKALPMRLFNRLGPALASLAAAALILLGAAFGWHLLPAQAPQEAAKPPQGKRSFAAAVETLQKRSDAQANGASSLELRIAGGQQTGAKVPKVEWRLTATEVIGAGKIEHRVKDWAAMLPFLKQVTGGGATIVRLVVSYPATRLDANQAVNLCKRAGFTTLEYSGPELFFGRSDDHLEALGDRVKAVAFKVEFAGVKGDLPDWTNGWIVFANRITRADQVKTPTDILSAVVAAGGTQGPAASLGASLNPRAEAGTPPIDASDLAVVLARQQIAGPAFHNLVSITNLNQNTRFELRQNGDQVRSETNDSKAFFALLVRTARSEDSTGFDVQGGFHSEPTIQQSTQVIDPLAINGVINALKRGGASEINYVGQPLFTGEGSERDAIDVHSTMVGRRIVSLAIRPGATDGELPDGSNGWTMLRRMPGWWVVKTSERERLEADLQPIKSGDARYDAEIQRLAKLPLDEFERELAKKPTLLRNRWRKAVEELKAKQATPKSVESQATINQIDGELKQINEEIAYWKWRLKPGQFERSAHVQSMATRKGKLEQQRKSVAEAETMLR